VVLPFVNICGSAQDDTFVDGITETLTTDLSRSSGVFAISRSTAFAYKGRPMDLRQIGRELGVRYVLEGSMQCAGDRLPINAQLADAECGANLWAERFDNQRTDLLDRQGEVTTRLVPRRPHRADRSGEPIRGARTSRPPRRRRLRPARPGGLEPASVARGGAAGPPFFLRRRFASTNTISPRCWAFANAHMWEVNIHVSDDRAGQIRAAEAAVTKALALVPTARMHMLPTGPSCSRSARGSRG
jgi:TolB-like protein